MTIQQLGYFMKLAEELNFTNVARDFYITQPTLSRQIVNLETELNTDLFIREHNVVKLTAAGRDFYIRIKPVFEEMIGIIKETQLRENRKESLCIGVQEEQLMSNSLTLAVNRLRNKYPDLTVNLLRSTTPELIAGLENGKFDIINTLKYSNLLYSDDMVFLLLEKESTYLYVANNLVEECDKYLEIGNAELVCKYADRYSMILPSPHRNMNEDVPKKIFMENFNVKEDSIKFGDAVTPISVPIQVANGLGVSIGNKSCLSLIDPQITMFKIENTNDSYFKGVFYKNNSGNKYIKELMNLVREEKELFFD